MLSEEFRYQISVLDHADYDEITVRLIALYEWMEAQQAISSVLDSLRSTSSGWRLLEEASQDSSPKARTHEEVAAIGLELIERCRSSGQHLFEIAMGAGIRAGDSSYLPDQSNAALKRYIEPFLNFVARRLPRDTGADAAMASGPAVPVAIQESLAQFRVDHPDPQKVCFVMMQFGKTPAHDAIERGIKATLDKYNIRGLLARDKDYHDELYPNIQTYMHGCGFGVAVFERIETETFNPNVSLEVGYMLGMKKRVLLLKDRTLATLQTDLVGRLYKVFDAQDPEKTIRPELERWLEDKGLI